MSVRILRIEMSSMPFFVDPLVIVSEAHKSDAVHFSSPKADTREDWSIIVWWEYLFAIKGLSSRINRQSLLE